MKKLSIYTDLGYPVSLERRLELIQDAGLTAYVWIPTPIGKCK